jgi:hypothetical protein
MNIHHVLESEYLSPPAVWYPNFVYVFALSNLQQGDLDSLVTQASVQNLALYLWMDITLSELVKELGAK